MWCTWLLIFFSFTLTGCCSKVILTPKMPEKVRGWKEIKESASNRVSVGEFLLKRGETVDNSKFGIQFVNIERRTQCGDGFLERNTTPTGAYFRFYRVSDGKELLLRSACDRNSMSIDGNEELGNLNNLYVHALNTEDEWVWFEIYRYEYDK